MKILILSLFRPIISFSKFILLSLYHITSKVFTWKNIIRGICAATCGIFLRLIIKHHYNIDLLTCFLDSHADILQYLYAFAYFFTNTFVGLFLGEFIELLFINFIKENVTHFLGIPLGINKMKFPLDGKPLSKITEISTKEDLVLKASRESSPSEESVSSSGSSSSASRHRSLSPFSRPASPPTFSRPASPTNFSRAASPAPSFGQGEFDPRTDPGYHPGSPSNPSSIWPEYFRQDFASPRPPVVWYIDTVIQHICRATYNIHGPIAPPDDISWEDNNTWAMLPPFGYDPTLNIERNNPFHTWYPIISMDQCTVLHLKCVIARLEHGKVILEITHDNYGTVPIIEGMPRSTAVIDRLLVDANRALIAKTTNTPS